MFDLGEIDGADIEDGFGGAVSDAGATGDVAVGAVTGENIGEDGGGAVSRQGFYEDEPSDFFGDTESAKERCEQTDESVFQSADFKELCEHHDGGDIGKYRHDEGQSALDALGEAVVDADFFEDSEEKGEEEDEGNDEGKKFHFCFPRARRSRFSLRAAVGTNNLTRRIPKTVENAVASMVGRMMSAAAALPAESRRATTEVGMSCREVALTTKSMEEE